MKHCKNILSMLAVALLAACSSDDNSLSPNGNDTTATIGTSPFTRAATDTLSVADFRRSYGVGFSYDGIYGEQCNLQDVHCRVLDLNALRAWEQEDEWNEQLFTLLHVNEYTIESDLSYSKSQYVQRSVLHADVKAKLLLFNGEAQANVTLWEQGDVNSLYMQVRYSAPGAALDMDASSVTTLITDEGREDLLTPNFREAVDWLRHHHDALTVDSFLTRYGSHVVTRSRVGGSLTLTMRMDLNDYTDIQEKQVLGDVAIKGILNTKMQTDEEKKALLKLDKAECSVEIRGGDLSKIPNELLHFQFSARPDLSSYVKAWAQSINFDSENPQACNLEMTDMTVTPIWDFIADEEVANRVRIRVEGTTADLSKLMGQHNFVNTSFTLPDRVTCLMGGISTTFNQPPTANIIAAGRIVATVCREKLTLPSGLNAEVQVAYPVYEGSVNLRCGYCTYDGLAYSVRWLGNQCQVDTLGDAGDGTVWLNLGEPSSAPFANLSYQQSHTVVGYEWPGSITMQGGLDYYSPYYLVYKQANQFLLRSASGEEQAGFLNALPNWSYDNTLHRMVRDENYKYYWNPNEVNY